MELRLPLKVGLAAAGAQRQMRPSWPRWSMRGEEEKFPACSLDLPSKITLRGHSSQCLAAGHYRHHCSVSLGRERVRKPWVGQREEGEPSPPLLLPKGIFYSLLGSPKVTWLQHCSTLSLPSSWSSGALEPRGLGLG